MSLLPASLRLLLWLHVVGFWRRLVRNARKPKGLVLTIVGVGLVVLWLLPMLFGAFFSKQSVTANPSTLRDWLPLVMLTFCLVTLLTTAGGRPVTFTPAETDFLFPGPYTRRQILMYRLVRSSFGSIIGAAFFSVGFSRQTGSFLGTFLVAILAFQFLLFFSTASAQVGQLLAEKVSSARQRVVIGLGAGVLAFVGLYFAPVPMPSTRPAEGLALLLKSVTAFRDSVPVRVLTSPFQPFAEAVAAPDWGSRLVWCVVACGVVVVTLAACLKLDADYLEASATAAIKRAEVTQKALRTGVAFNPTRSDLRLPHLPRWGGVGPIIWRQGTTALRSLRVVLLILFIACCAFGPILMLKGIKDPTGPLMGMIAMFTFLGGGLFRFDFRADVDRLDTLKLLPVSSSALAIGQIATPVVMLTCFQWVLCLIIAATSPARPMLPVWLAIYLPLVSVLLLAIENIAFLLVPNRNEVATPGDVTVIARSSLIFLVKFTVLGAVAGVAIAFAFLVRWVTSSEALGFIAGWVVVAAAAAAVIPTIAWAFDRLDVSADAAPNS